MKYKIVHYKDGLYHDHYRIKAWRWWFPFWITCYALAGYDWSEVIEFDTRKEAEVWISQTITYDLLSQRRAVRKEQP